MPTRLLCPQGTMTVFESVLLSAVLRLPDDMPLSDKATRVMRVLKDLRLTHVADSYVGNKSKRYDNQHHTQTLRHSALA
jgi:ABC-type multidrug transport system ATPase subunit